MKPIRYAIILFCCLLGSQQAGAAQALLDQIVAIVDESVITQRELENRIQLVKIDFRESNRRLPDNDVLQRQVLEALISDSLMLQEASRRGIKISDSQLNQTMQRLARQNSMTLSDYRRALIADGFDYDQYREAVRKELTITSLERQYGQSNASISDAEVDEFIAQSGETDNNYEYRISHILIALPDAAAPEQITEARRKADEILSRLDQGEEFDRLANTYSSGDNALQGGDLGWRKKAAIPSLFTDQVLSMSPGDHAGPIRSASGLHIVYLKDRRNLEQTLTRQTRSRHILIRPNELISEEDAQSRLLEFRQRILAGEDFERLARLYSVDYSTGAEGGDLGWTDPGATVKEYEAVLDQLQEGEISEPFRTQYGWHIVQLTGRRTVDETAQNQRDKIYSQLLEQKQREVFDLWKRRLRDEAYVVFPDEPDA